MEQKLRESVEHVNKHLKIQNPKLVFMFYYGGKPITDSESTISAKQAGGDLKSVPARLLANQIMHLQDSASHNNTIIVPIFAQYGNTGDLEDRMESHNDDFCLCPHAQNYADWNNFADPAALIVAADKLGISIFAGNGGTNGHFVSAMHGLDRTENIVLYNEWTNDPSMEIWSAAHEAGIIHLIQAPVPQDLKPMPYEEALSRRTAADRGPKVSQRLKTSQDAVVSQVGEHIKTSYIIEPGTPDPDAAPAPGVG